MLVPPIIMQKENCCQKERPAGKDTYDKMAGGPEVGMKKIGTALLVLGLCSTAQAQHLFKTKSFLMEIASSSQVVELVDLNSRKNYVPEGRAGYLVRIRTEGKELAASSLTVQKDVLSLAFPGGIGLEVRAAGKGDYLRFELIKAVHPEKIDAVLWGPINTAIGETIGEVVGVVRDKDFAVGIQALNAKTCGGKLVNDEGTTGGRTTATPEEFGSSLQAFCVNQARDRMITVWNLYKNVPVKALPGFTLEGSALAVFGTAPAEVLPLIGRIEVAEGLPHPVLDGQWLRASGAAGRPYLIAAFGEKTIEAMLEYTRRLGFAALYHSGPFKTWGHFDLLEDLFPNGRAGFKSCVDKGRAMGLRVGAHTLTNFITTNDPFVTTAANKGLMAAGMATLQKAVDPAATEIVVDRQDYFKQASTLNSVLIGAEIVRYRAVNGTGPYTLTDCVRGVFGTTAAGHAKGSEVRMLMDHPYKTFFPDWPMQEELIRNLAGFFNETGTAQLDFDGHEGTCYLGRGDFGHVHFVEAFLGQVDHLVVNGSSNIGHYYWHFNSYINWGEPWYASFRESQSRYRFDNQPFLERNYMPNMLGWFLMTPATTVEDIEWMEARAAGYRAGYAFVAEYETLTGNPATDLIIEAIRTWEEAKELKVFDEDERARLKDPDRDFHLEKTGAGRWTLQSYDKFLFEHGRKVRQPGEPAASEWTFENAREPQPLHLQLLVTGENAAVENIEIEVDRFFRVTVPRALKKGQSLVWDGSGQAIIYSDKGQLVERVPLGRTLPLLQKGRHVVAIDAKFADGGEPLIKGTVRLKGGIEEIAR
jgi:hypothetical protein